jgi:hypothetical protein
MKNILVLLLAAVLYSPFANAQAALQLYNIKRNVRFRFLANDSVNLSLSDEFNLTEDSCRQIIRHAHLNRQTRKFFGEIKDVSSLDTTLVLTEGNYTTAGLKDGYFITHYLNGKLQAKGNFKNDEFDGPWEIYYADGSPKLKFEANGPDIKITDAWDDKGNKLVENGKGPYRVNMGSLYWEGKLLNGKPDGKWAVMKTDDATHIELNTEKYKDGIFQKGSNQQSTYTDAPRLKLVSSYLLPFSAAEELHISLVPCGGVKRKHIVGAQYRNGLASFTDNVKTLVSQYFRTVNISSYQTELVLEGEVSVDGFITKLRSQSGFDPDIERGLIGKLRLLPPLEPATVDGKPTPQKFIITFSFNSGSYRFSYRFLPIGSR